jgi:hypothetical protein
VSYGDLRKQCLEAIRQWPGCQTVSGIRIIRDRAKPSIAPAREPTLG